VRKPAIPLIALVAMLAGVVFAGDLSAAPTTKQKLQAKQAQAQSVLGQVNALDRRFEASVEAWHGAQYELQTTHAELLKDRRTLGVAERRRRAAVARVRARLVALYEGAGDPTTLGIFLGSSSVSELLDRLDAAKQVAAADHLLAVQTTAARDRYAALARRTAALEQQRRADVEQLAAQRQRIGSMLGERKRLLASVQGEVTQLRAQEQHEQRVLAAQARARLAAAQAAAEREAAARAQAAKDRAAEAKAATAPVPAPAATPTTTAAEAPPTTTTVPPVTTAPDPTTTAPAPAPAPPAVSSAGAGHPEAAAIALRYLGIKYTWGGSTPAGGFDCSGLVMYVYAQLGISLPHYAAAQFGMGTPVARSDLQPGDLVFFDNLNHVGIYIGGGQMVHAPQTGDVVKITPLSQFGAGYVGARRI
jgi:cell wall-associated NlpC family hydrolase